MLCCHSNVTSKQREEKQSQIQEIVKHLMNCATFDLVMQRIQLLSTMPRPNMDELVNFWEKSDFLFSGFFSDHPEHKEKTINFLSNLSLHLLSDKGIFLTAYDARKITNGSSFFYYFTDINVPPTLLSILKESTEIFAQIKDDLENYTSPRLHRALSPQEDSLTTFRRFKSICSTALSQTNTPGTTLTSKGHTKTLF